MKISSTNSIRISGNQTLIRFLSGIRRDSEISAKIVSRINAKSAIIEIGGKRIKSEFTGGVPAEDRITLKLQGNNRQTFIFKLIDNKLNRIFLDELSEFTLFTTDYLSKNKIFSLKSFLGQYPKTIFDLNYILLNRNGSKSGDKDSAASLFNRLLKLGLKKESLIYLTYIISSRSIDPSILIPFYFILGYNKNLLKKINAFREDEIEEIVAGIISDIENIDDIDDKMEIILKLLNIIINESGDFKNSAFGELCYLDGNEFRTLKFISTLSSLIFSLNLSNLGIVDILLKKIDNKIMISLFSDSEKVITSFQKSLDKLYLRLDNLNINFSVSLFNSRNILDKLLNVDSSSILESGIDIRV